MYVAHFFTAVNFFEKCAKFEKVKNIEKLSDAPLDRPIVYRAGLVTDNKEAKEWFEFLKTKEAKQIFKDYHFEE